MNIAFFSGLKRAKLSFVLLLVLFLALPISAVHAGIFSFLGDIFDNSVKYDRSYVNSQTASVLQAAINPDTNPPRGGGDIVIVGNSALLPESGPSGTIADITNTSPKSGQISVYVVRDGDSLSQIAKMFGVSTNTLIWANDIGNGQVIRPGQQLVILPISGLEYTVQKGDTPAGIAKKYAADVNEIIDYNGITDESPLIAGVDIVIPGGKKATPVYSSANKVVRGTSAPAIDGYYLRPISDGRKSQGLHGYNAVDLAAPFGTPIVASASGRVIISKESSWSGGYGNYIVIEHPNGTQTLYAHNSGNIVKTGQWAVQGQVIGYVGNTGRSTGPHVHFEIRGARNPF